MDIQTIKRAYIQSFCWVNEIESTFRLSLETEKIIEGWIKTFLEKAESVLKETDYLSDLEILGTDLYLTHNYHSTGFFENNYCTKVQGEILTKLARELPEFNINLILI